MSEERILRKFIRRPAGRQAGRRQPLRGRGRRLLRQAQPRNRTRYVVENDEGVLHIASERQLQLAMPKRS